MDIIMDMADTENMEGMDDTVENMGNTDRTATMAITVLTAIMLTAIMETRTTRPSSVNALDGVPTSFYIRHHFN